MFKHLRIRTKILLAFAIVAIIAVSTIALVAFSIGRSTLEQESFNKLTAVREMKASQVEDYFQLIEDQAVTLSKDRMIIDAMGALEGAYHTIPGELALGDADMEQLNNDLEAYYQDEFFRRLIPNLLREPVLSDYYPENIEARILQNQFIMFNRIRDEANVVLQGDRGFNDFFSGQNVDFDADIGVRSFELMDYGRQVVSSETLTGVNSYLLPLLDLKAADALFSHFFHREYIIRDIIKRLAGFG